VGFVRCGSVVGPNFCSADSVVGPNFSSADDEIVEHNREQHSARGGAYHGTNGLDEIFPTAETDSTESTTPAAGYPAIDQTRLRIEDATNVTTRR
jgi:hypothetical protein